MKRSAPTRWLRSHAQRELQRRRSLNCLPPDVLSYVFELSVSRLEEVAPLARVSKLFNVCVKRLNVLGRLELRTHERMSRRFPGLDNDTHARLWRRFLGLEKKENDEEDKESRLAEAAASAELTTTLRQVRLGCPAIGRIELGDHDFVDDEDGVEYVTDDHVRLVASFPSLRRVCLQGCGSVTDISPLRFLEGLTKLNLCYCERISGSGFACLSSLTSLQELDVGSTGINDEGLARLSRSLTALTKLNLYRCKSISGAGFACLSSLTSLQELEVSYTGINDEGLEGLSSTLTALTKLTLEYCESISSEGFACLSTLTSLQELNAGSTGINDEGLAVMSRSLTALTKLNLWYCESISGTGFACLSSLTSLQELDVQNTGINDEGLAVLSRSLTALTELNLGHCESISSEGFVCLLSWTSLRRLGAADTAIDDNVLMNLRNVIPILSFEESYEAEFG